MPDPPICLELGLKITGEKGLGALKFWNYNKSLIDSQKGFKEIEIHINGRFIKEAIIKKDCGNEFDEIITLVKIKEGVKLTDTERKEENKQIVEVNT